MKPKRHSVKMPKFFAMQNDDIYEQRETKTKMERLGYEVIDRTLIRVPQKSKKKPFNRKEHFARIREKFNHG